MDAEVMRRRAAQAGYWLCVGSGGSYESEAVSLFSAMATQPSDLRKAQINALIVSLKANGVWNKIGVFYVFAAHAAQTALLNWKAPTGTAAVATNSPTFTADRGYAGDGVSAFVDTQTAWNAVPGVAQDNAHFGVYARNLSATGNIAGLAAVQNVSIVRSTNQLFTALNNTITTTADAWSGTAGTYAVVSRSLSASYERYIDGAAVSSAAVASAALSSANIVALRRGNSYLAAGAQVCALHAGSALTAAEVLAARNAIQTYMVAVGAS